MTAFCERHSPRHVYLRGGLDRYKPIPPNVQTVYLDKLSDWPADVGPVWGEIIGLLGRNE